MGCSIESCWRVRLVWWAIAAALVAVPAAARAQELFYMYQGPAIDGMTSEILSCYLENYGGNVPWIDSSTGAELMTEIWVHRALMEHPQRTLDPEEATYFYIPAYFELSFRTWKNCCCKDGRTEALTQFLQRTPYFRRYDGSDHFTVCTSQYCHGMFNMLGTDTVSRIAVGNVEPGSSWFAGWGCFNKVFGVPYVARTTISAGAASKPPSQRTTTFYFHDSSQGCRERANIAAVAEVAPNTDIGTLADLHGGGTFSSMAQIFKSRFCFAPRGADGLTSHNFFDAVAAGCIPIVPESLRSQNDLPFASTVAYEEFVVFAPDSDFASRAGVQELAKRLLDLPDSQIDAMHAALVHWRPNIVVAAAEGNHAASVKTLPVSPQFGEALYDAAVAVMRASPFACTLPPFNPLEEGALVKEADWQWKATTLQIKREQWLIASTPFMIGRSDEWVQNGGTKVDFSKQILFCAVPGAGSEALEAALTRGGAAWQPLQTTRALASRTPFTSQWAQITIVRDPIVRLLATYLAEAEAQGTRPGAKEFRELVGLLGQRSSEGILDFEGSYRPQGGFCGARYRLFAAELQAEHLARDGPKLLRSLGMDDASVQSLQQRVAKEGEASEDAAAALFSGCGWTNYYDGATLSLAADIYSEDFSRLPYYSVDRWAEALGRCGKGQVGLGP